MVISSRWTRHAWQIPLCCIALLAHKRENVTFYFSCKAISSSFHGIRSTSWHLKQFREAGCHVQCTSFVVQGAGLYTLGWTSRHNPPQKPWDKLIDVSYGLGRSLAFEWAGHIDLAQRQQDFIYLTCVAVVDWVRQALEMVERLRVLKRFSWWNLSTNPKWDSSRCQGACFRHCKDVKEDWRPVPKHVKWWRIWGHVCTRAREKWSFELRGMRCLSISDRFLLSETWVVMTRMILSV